MPLPHRSLGFYAQLPRHYKLDIQAQSDPDTSFCVHICNFFMSFPNIEMFGPANQWECNAMIHCIILYVKVTLGGCGNVAWLAGSNTCDHGRACALALLDGARPQPGEGVGAMLPHRNSTRSIGRDCCSCRFLRSVLVFRETRKHLSFRHAAPATIP